MTESVDETSISPTDDPGVAFTQFFILIFNAYLLFLLCVKTSVLNLVIQIVNLFRAQLSKITLKLYKSLKINCNYLIEIENINIIVFKQLLLIFSRVY